MLSSLFLVYWTSPTRVVWTKDGIVTAVHQEPSSNSGTSWNVLVYIYQQTSMGYIVNTGYIALNGLGTTGHGNYCWDNGKGSCLTTPLNFDPNQALTVEALNNGNFMIIIRQL